LKQTEAFYAQKYGCGSFIYCRSFLFCIFSELFPLQIPIPMQQIAHWLRG